MAKYQHISLDQIVEPKQQIRTLITREGLETLAESIKDQGIIEPLVVSRNKTKYEIIAGQRRYLAAKMNNLKVVPCLVIEAKDQKRDLLKTHENLQREKINPVDLCKWLVYIQDRYKLTQKETAKLCGVSGAKVSISRLILTGDKQVLAALEAERITHDVAMELNRIDDDKVRSYYLELAIKNGATQKVVFYWRAQYEKLRAASKKNVDTSSLKTDTNPPQRLELICPLCGDKFLSDEMLSISVDSQCYRDIQAAFQETKKDRDHANKSQKEPR